MEVIDLGLNDLEPVSINFDTSGPPSSSTFGPGIELLMNDKKKTPSGSMNIDLGELDKLENELNDLSSSSNGGGGGGGDTKSLNGLSGFGSYFGFGGNSNTKEQTSSQNDKSDSNIGQATSESMGNTKTWDGFSKINEIPQSGGFGGGSKNLSDREKRRKKRLMIKNTINDDKNQFVLVLS
jgi:hypothetical protein